MIVFKTFTVSIILLKQNAAVCSLGCLVICLPSSGVLV